MIVQIGDVNISGYITSTYKFDNLEEVAEFLEYASGRWVESPDGGGDVLLDMPYAYVYDVESLDKFNSLVYPYPDWIIEHDMVGNYEVRTA